MEGGKEGRKQRKKGRRKENVTLLGSSNAPYTIFMLIVILFLTNTK